jgi:hypothetical protein
MKKLDSPLKAIILFFAFFPLSVFPQAYLWPTNASDYLSSSFCEFREGHYHSAIDIKTWNTEGYPCYAVADGFIKQLRVSPFGYGKVLYLQLEDGNTAVYAHLQKFSEAIDKQVLGIQFRNKKYRLNWRPKNLKIKKGDIIAYTGRTGIGVPHLHFEIRNKKDNPVNPLVYYSRIKDNIRPKLLELAIIPLTQTATINGSFSPKTVPVTHIKDGIYVIKEPLYAHGKVGLAINGYDQADDVYNKYGFHHTDLEVSGQKTFEIEYDELDFSTTEHIYSEIYYPYWVEKNQVFQKLYLESFNPLSFYNRSLATDGSIEVYENPMSFNITVSDFKKNRSIISGELLPAQKFSIEIIKAVRKKTWVYVKFLAPQIRDLKFFTGNNDRTWTPAEYFEILEGKIANPEKGLWARVALKDSLSLYMKIEVNKKINRSIYFGMPVISPEKLFQPYVLGEKLIVEIPDLNPNTQISLLHDQARLGTSFPEAESRQVIIPARLISGKPRTLIITTDSVNTPVLNLNFDALYPNETTTSSWFDSALVIQSSEGSVMDTTLITVEILEIDTVLNKFPTASKIFEISPRNFPIFNSLSIRIQADSIPAWGHWSVFKTNGEDKISYLSSTIDSRALHFTTKTSSLGKFVIAADTIPPEVSIIEPITGQTYKKSPEIQIKTKDLISGIGDEEDISLVLDGNYVLPEWDPEEDILTGILANDLSAGNHILTVSISDRSGNTTRKAVYFKTE